MRKLWVILAVLLLVGCGSKDQCPRCSHEVDFSEDVFCSNCGMTFTGIKPDGYEEYVPEVKRPSGTYSMTHKFGTEIVTFDEDRIHHQYFNGKENSGTFTMSGNTVEVAWNSGTTDTYTYDANSDTLTTKVIDGTFEKTSDD